MPLNMKNIHGKIFSRTNVITTDPIFFSLGKVVYILHV